MNKTRCWICKDGFMWLTNDVPEMEGLPACQCDVCGAVASATTTARHQAIGETVTWVTQKFNEHRRNLTNGL